MDDLVIQAGGELSPEDSSRVNSIIKDIDLANPTFTVTYGAETMADIARFADNLLSRVRAKDAGEIGESLTQLMVQVQSFDGSGMEKKSGLERLPLIGSLFSSAKKNMAEFKTISDQISVISETLDDAMKGLLKDISILEELYGHNEKFHHDLSIYIKAGQAYLEKARNEDLPALKEKADKSGSSMDAQKVKDFSDMILRFERRLHDLQLSRTVTIQTAPQIRLIQNNNQTLVEKIQTSILSTIPIWKGQVVLGLSLKGQRASAELQKKVSDTTNDLLRTNAEMLKESGIATAKEVERSVVDIDTLRDVQTNLIETIEETLKIARDAREKRLSVEAELKNMEENLKNKLTSLAAENRKDVIASASKAIDEA